MYSNTYLGRFPDQLSAAFAYDCFVLNLLGPKAHINNVSKPVTYVPWQPRRRPYPKNLQKVKQKDGYQYYRVSCRKKGQEYNIQCNTLEQAMEILAKKKIVKLNIKEKTNR